MNEEKLIEILKNIGQTDVPPNIAHIAEQASQRFASTLNILQAQRLPLTTFLIGFRRIAVAAAILFVFAIGLSVGRWSKPPQTQMSSLDLPDYVSPVPTHAPVQQAKDSFWQQKMLAAMQPRPYAQTQFNMNAYKQYLKEKYND
jgi:hypothetical protein